MAQPPQLNRITPANGQTNITASQWAQLQNNVSTYVSQYMPLMGGAFTGTVTFVPSQSFDSRQVKVTNPGYPHASAWQSVADHIADPTVHQQPGAPLQHAPSHEIGGADPLYGSLIGISPSQPGISIQNWAQSVVNAASAAYTTNFAPASWYEIGGNSPLYGNLIGININNPNEDIKTYIDTSIAAAGSGGYPQNPILNSMVLSGTASSISFANGPGTITAQGVAWLSTDGINTAIATRGNAGQITFGNQVTSNLFGTLSASGYTIGGTVIGSTASVFAGTLTTNNDIWVSRTALSSATSGAIHFGSAGQGAYLSYNSDFTGQFYLADSLVANGDISLMSGSYLTVGGGNLQFGGILNSTICAGIATSPSGLDLRIVAQEGGKIGIGYDNTSLVKINLGPTASWGYFSSSGLTMGSTVISQYASNLSGPLSVNGAFIGQAGDISGARAPGQGVFWFGQGATAGTLDYGVTTPSSFTFSSSGSNVVYSQIGSDGTYLVGSSSYGPLQATVNGILTANSGIYAQTGVTFAGTSGYTFTGNGTGDTGMFSSGPGDLRFYTSSVKALCFQNTGQQAVFVNNVTVPGNLTSQTIAASGNVIVGGNLTLNNSLYAGTTTISKFRTKDMLDLGYHSGVVAASAIYMATPVPNFSGGQIENLWISTITPDTNSTQTTFNILKNGIIIGQVSLTNGATISSNYPTINPTPITMGDQLHAVCTTVGTATGVNISVEVSQFVY